MKGNKRFFPIDGVDLTDYGPDPFVVNIDQVVKKNEYYRTALWTGNDLQLTLMRIPVGGEIGIEMHEDADQFIRIEDGFALVKMGRTAETLNEQKMVDGNFGIFVPQGTWHNIINLGNQPLKLYSVYAPPHHPFGTVQETKEMAEAEKKNDASSL